MKEVKVVRIVEDSDDNPEERRIQRIFYSIKAEIGHLFTGELQLVRHRHIDLSGSVYVYFRLYELVPRKFLWWRWNARYEVMWLYTGEYGHIAEQDKIECGVFRRKVVEIVRTAFAPFNTVCPVEVMCLDFGG